MYEGQARHVVPRFFLFHEQAFIMRLQCTYKARL